MCINNRHLKADFYFPFWVHRILVIEASKLIQFTWILSLQYKCKPSTCPHSWFIYLPTSIYPLVFSYSLCEFFFFFFWQRCAAWGILVPPPGIKPALPAVEARSLTTGPPGTSLMWILFPYLPHLHLLTGLISLSFVFPKHLLSFSIWQFLHNTL